MGWLARSRTRPTIRVPPMLAWITFAAYAVAAALITSAAEPETLAETPGSEERAVTRSASFPTRPPA